MVDLEAGALLLTGAIVISLVLALAVVNFWRYRVESQAETRTRKLEGALRRLKKKEAEDQAHTTELEKTKEALMHAMDDLTDSYEKLKGLDELKSDFVTNVSHELRTPLTTLGLTFDLLEKEKNPGKRREMMEMLHRNTRRLQDTVDTILDFSVIESGKASLEKKRFSLSSLANEVVKAEGPKAEVKGVSLEVNVPKGLFVTGDRRWLARAFTNLVDNAVKFTDKGYVRVSAKRQKSYILVSVKDSGKGISKKDLPKIFNKFIKLETHVPGSGVGLWATQKVVERQGGKIWVESKKGKGTEMFFTIPVGGKK
ncbi:ATP-binding protein [archaeon]